ncbi:MAG TPA: UDP-N-acetylmuramate dehydrogenase [Bacteroidia bacterium]|nr:UDP-N-acetylmuramate dehydrogenase [Bacteroidia bacterium]
MNKAVVEHNKSLKALNTFGIDVSAAFYAAFENLESLHELLADAQLKQLPLLILGGGSNMLFTGNFEGLVIHNKIKGIELTAEDDRHWYVTCGAGEVWHQFVLWCINRNYAGLENLSLIPGSAGAGPLQNIGAYGVEFKDHFHRLEALELSTGKVRSFDLAECKFGYRDSVFKQELKGKFIVLSITMRLDKHPEYRITYGAIAAQLKKMNVDYPDTRSISDAVISIRRSKLPDPAVLGNAGSFFKNPEVSAGVYEALKNAFPELIAYELSDGNFKLAAGWLIEQCGWKGKRTGNVGSHKDQALVLVNYGNATGTEVYDLAMEIQASVAERFGVKIMPEVNII